MNEYTNFGVYTRGENEFSFNFNTSLNAQQKAEFVSVVSDIVVKDNYYDFLIDIIFDYAIIAKFTDVDLSDIAELDAIERFLDETNIVDIVKENAGYEFIDSLRNSVEKCIEYKTGIHRNLLDEALSSLVKTFENMVSSVDIDEIVNMGQMLSGISGELTADKILDAYSKSDMYKTNWKQDAVDDNTEIKVIDGGKKSSRKADNAPSTTLQSPEYEA